MSDWTTYVQCPACHQYCSVGDDSMFQVVRCPACGVIFDYEVPDQ